MNIEIDNECEWRKKFPNDKNPEVQEELRMWADRIEAAKKYSKEQKGKVGLE